MTPLEYHIVPRHDESGVRLEIEVRGEATPAEALGLAMMLLDSTREMHRLTGEQFVSAPIKPGVSGG